MEDYIHDTFDDFMHSTTVKVIAFIWWVPFWAALALWVILWILRKVRLVPDHGMSVGSVSLREALRRGSQMVMAVTLGGYIAVALGWGLLMEVIAGVLRMLMILAGLAMALFHPIMALIGMVP